MQGRWITARKGAERCECFCRKPTRTAWYLRRSNRSLWSELIADCRLPIADLGHSQSAIRNPQSAILRFDFVAVGTYHSPWKRQERWRLSRADL